MVIKYLDYFNKKICHQEFKKSPNLVTLTRGHKFKYLNGTAIFIELLFTLKCIENRERGWERLRLRLEKVLKGPKYNMATFSCGNKS